MLETGWLTSVGPPLRKPSLNPTRFQVRLADIDPKHLQSPADLREASLVTWPSWASDDST